MARIIGLLFSALLVLSACSNAMTGPPAGTDGSSSTRIHRIRPNETSTIQYRMLDSVNSLRQASGAAPLTLDSRLNAAAATHSRDMSLQNRPWHFGSDGSSPIDRARRVGYDGTIVGENISETYEDELETLAAWMQDENTRRIILSKEATEMGFAWEQETNGKIWWTMVTGRSGRAADPSS